MLLSALRGGGAAAAAATTTMMSPLALLSRSYSWYVTQCTQHPYVTKSITAAVVTSMGDILSQRLNRNKETDAADVSNDANQQQPKNNNNNNNNLNITRLVTFFLCGLCYVGPFVHTWYEQLWKLGRFLRSSFGWTSPLPITLAQLFADQTLGVLLFFPPYFYVFELLESLVSLRPPSFQRATKQCQNQVNDVFWMQYRVFPITNLINFGIIPVSLRVLFSNLVSLLFNIYLTMKVSGGEPDKE